MHEDVQGFSSRDPSHDLLFPPLKWEPQPRAEAWTAPCAELGQVLEPSSRLILGFLAPRADKGKCHQARAGRPAIQSVLLGNRRGRCGQGHSDGYNYWEAVTRSFFSLTLVSGKQGPSQATEAQSGSRKACLPQGSSGRALGLPFLTDSALKWARQGLAVASPRGLWGA